MKVAIPSNDGKKIFRRTGRANGFVIAEIGNDNYSLLDTIENGHRHEHHDDEDEDGHGHSHEELVNSLDGCEFMIVNIVGKHLGADLQNGGIKVFKTPETSVEGALADFMAKNQII